jgi:hypothetical protein
VGAAFDPYSNSTLYLLNSLPNNYFGSVDLSTGEFKEIGPLGHEISAVGGFDVVPDYPKYGFASLYTESELKTSLYRVNLIDGSASKIADLSFTTNILSFAAIEESSISPARRFQESMSETAVDSITSIPPLSTSSLSGNQLKSIVEEISQHPSTEKGVQEETSTDSIPNHASNIHFPIIAAFIVLFFM